MTDCILDSSALLALLNSETGKDIVEKLLPTSIMSTVNVAEVIAEIELNLSISSEKCKEMIMTLVDKIVPLDIDQATSVASLRKVTKKFGLSLGDRACIALGKELKLPIYTADKVWKNLDLDCKIVLIR